MSDALVSSGRASARVHERGSEDQSRRDARLRNAILAVDPSDLRRALAGAPRPVQEELAKGARTPVPVLLRMGSNRPLARIKDPILVATLAELLSDECLDAVRAQLGARADDPDRSEILTALDVIGTGPFSPQVTAVMLASVAAGDAAAADVCDEILDIDPRFRIPDASPAQCPAPAAPSIAKGKRAADAAQRQARRERRAEVVERRRVERLRAAAAADQLRAARKRGQVAGLPPDPAPVDKVPDDAGHADAPALEMRRRPQVSESDAHRFDVEGPLVGSVVIAEVRFDAEDPKRPDLVSKWRPVVVIGESRTHLLVRAGYSVGGFKTRTWKSYELRDWAEAGLRERTWIEAKPRRIPRYKTTDPLGTLSARDWNSLW